METQNEKPVRTGRAARFCCALELSRISGHAQSLPTRRAVGVMRMMMPENEPHDEQGYRGADRVVNWKPGARRPGRESSRPLKTRSRSTSWHGGGPRCDPRHDAGATLSAPLRSFWGISNVPSSEPAGVGRRNAGLYVRAASVPVAFAVALAAALPTRAALASPPPAFDCSWSYCCNQYPAAITTASNGHVYVATRFFHYTEVLEYDGCDFVAYHGVGSGTPAEIAVDDSGIVYVASYECNCVLRFDNGVTWGGTGSAPGQFDGLRGIAIDEDGYVYAADRRNHRVQKLLRDGTPVLSFGRYGTGPGELSAPYSIAVDRAGSVYVTDPANKRVQKYSTGGEFITEWGLFGGGADFGTPYGIAADGHGGVFVSDYWGTLKFSDTGEFLSSWTMPDSAGSFDVSADGEGAIYVMDPYTLVAKFHEISPLSVGNLPRSPLAMEPPAPNPFRDRCVFSWSQPNEATIDLSLVDVSGRKIATVASGWWSAGRHRMTWSAADAVSRGIGPGIYWVRLRSRGREVTRTLVHIE